MSRLAPGIKVYLACQPVDLRRGFDGLSAEVARVLAADPFREQPSSSAANAATA